MTAEQIATIKRCWGRVAIEMTDTANELKKDYAALAELINENVNGTS